MRLKFDICVKDQFNESKINLMESQVTENSLIKMFIEIDDFCKSFQEWETNHQVKESCKWSSKLSRSEAMTILVYYNNSGYKCFQYYYQRLVRGQMLSYFPKAPTYKYFLRLIPKVFELMYLYAQWQSSNAQKTGIYYVDSKKLPVCHNKRIHTHKVFKGIAQRGKSSMGWFFGMKIHLVINNLGEINSFLLTSANFADNNKEVLRSLFENVKGHVFGDKGYLTTLFEEFYAKGLKIVTKIKRNMKNKLLPLNEKYALMKRGVIESVNDILMTVCDIEHTRHRSPINAMTHILSALVSYNYLENKPSVLLNNLIES